jgi:hypothetical protein
MTALIIMAAYLGLLLGLGQLSKRFFRGTARDYFLASHSIGPVLLLMSVFGTTMTAFALVGSTGEAYRGGIGVYGMMASWSGLIHAAVFFFVGIRLWALGKRYGYLTQVQYFRDRFESESLGLLLFPILVGLIIPYLLMGLLGAGGVVRSLTRGAFPEAFAATQGGVPPWLTGLVISAVVLWYIFFGGLRGAAWANTFQTCVFLVTGLITFWVIASGCCRRQREGSAASSRALDPWSRDNSASLLHLLLHPTLGGNVPPPVSALAYSPLGPDLSAHRNCASHPDHAGLGALCSDRRMGYGSHDAGWEPDCSGRRSPQHRTRPDGAEADRPHLGRAAGGWNSGRHYVVPRFAVSLPWNHVHQ